ncbi:MAG: helix-hairpin-helix domain-containing protein [Paracoccaceae bacterium]|nr:helix-hairpin-helix domain-containing protein [Paracoccaceae bacterium]
MSESVSPNAGQLSRGQIAERLEEAAELLETQGADRFRVRAYRQAAGTVRSLAEDPGEILAREGLQGLIDLPTIGEGLAWAIDEMATTGRWMQIERLRGESDAESLLQTVPGVGPKTARLIHDEMQIDTLEAVETAAHDDRLEAVPGIGPRRAATIRGGFADMLARRRRRSADDHDESPVRLLLDFDVMHCKEAAAGCLRKIAPRRFNPSGDAWLPILHRAADGWELTALFQTRP